MQSWWNGSVIWTRVATEESPIWLASTSETTCPWGQQPGGLVKETGGGVTFTQFSYLQQEVEDRQDFSVWTPAAACWSGRQLQAEDKKIKTEGWLADSSVAVIKWHNTLTEARFMIDSLLNSLTDDSLAKTPPNFNYEVKTCQVVSAPSFHLQLLPVSFFCSCWFQNADNVPLPHSLTVFLSRPSAAFGLVHAEAEPITVKRLERATFNKRSIWSPVSATSSQNFKALLRVNILSPEGNLKFPVHLTFMPLEGGGKLVQQVEKRHGKVSELREEVKQACRRAHFLFYRRTWGSVLVFLDIIPLWLSK